MICFLILHGDSVSVTARMRVEEVLASEMEDKEGGDLSFVAGGIR